MTTTGKLLTMRVAAKRATARLRRPVSVDDVVAWVVGGRLPHQSHAGHVYVAPEALSEFLAAIEPDERLLSVGDAVVCLARDHDTHVTGKTVMNWYRNGIPTPEGRLVLKTVRINGGYRRIHPKDLAEFVKAAGPNLGRPGRRPGKREAST